MQKDSERWNEVNPSRYAWEREGIAFVREGLPDAKPYRGWANVEFVGEDRSLNEIDLLVTCPTGIFLIEIKSHPGIISGNGQQWTWIRPDGTRQSIANPLFTTQNKCHRLENLVSKQSAWRNLKGRARLQIEPIVFLSNPDLDCQLNPAGRIGVYGRGLPPRRVNAATIPNVLDLLKNNLKDEERNRRGAINAVDSAVSNAFAEALVQAGIRPSTGQHRVGDYDLLERLGDGPGWEDWRALHRGTGVHRRIRRWLTTETHTVEEEQHLERAARREFELRGLLNHPNVLLPVDLQFNEYGPALVFDDDQDRPTLDVWLADEGASLSLDARLRLVRQIAETVDFAHRKQVFHRTLGPSSIRVGQDHDGQTKVWIADWQSAAREAETRSVLVGTEHVGDLIDDSARLYLAPETANGFATEPVRSDVFSVGAIAYLLFSGHAPGVDLADFRERLRESGGLDLSADVDGVSEYLRVAVRDATNPQLDDRLGSVREFLDWLDIAAADQRPPSADPDHDVVDPVQAEKGDHLEGGWMVERRLGRGATAVALLATRLDRTEVLKVAVDAQHFDLLRTEHEVLQTVRHKGIVTSYDLDEIGGRVVLHLESAGDETLAEHLRRNGRLSLGNLQRWGDDLLETLAHLEQEGIAHRDIKPDNLAIKARKPNNELHLVMFDFSLSRTPAENIRAGTPGYLDPFLDERPNKRWDWPAERWSVAVVLYEMATGVRPRYEGGGDPGLVPGIEAEIDPAQFDPSVASGLRDFFVKALRRDPSQRFDTVEEMRSAWSAALARINEPVLAGTDLGDRAAVDDALQRSVRDTPLVELHLTPKVLDVLSRLNVHTAGQLADTNIQKLQRMAGVGDKTRREISRLARALVDRFASEPEEFETSDAASIDRMAGLLYRKGTARTADGTLVRMVLEPHLPMQTTFLGATDALGPWPSHAEVAEAAGIAIADVKDATLEATRRWKKIAAFTRLRTDLIDVVRRSGGVMTADELASAALDLRGSAAALDQRLLRARAVVRAVLEEDQARADAQWVLRRDAERLVVSDDQDPNIDGTVRAVWALAVGDVADSLVAGDELPTTADVVTALRAVEAPAALLDLPDARLIRLAAAASRTASTSTRLDLYPRLLPPARSVVMARPALVTASALSVDAVQSRVRARFPDAAPLPPRPALDALLDSIGLIWDTGLAAYRLPTVASSESGRSTHLPTMLPPTEIDLTREAALEFDQRMQRLAAGGGYCVVNVATRHVEGAEHLLAQRHGFVVVDVDLELIDAMRAVAQSGNADWAVVSAADATRATPEWNKLQQLVVKPALPALRERVLRAGPTVLLSGIGLLGRYGQLGLLDELRDHTTGVRRLDGVALRGLAVLVPTETPDRPPTIAGEAVAFVGANQWTSVPRRWLEPGFDTVRGGSR